MAVRNKRVKGQVNGGVATSVDYSKIAKPSDNEIATLKQKYGAIFGIAIAPSGPTEEDGMYFIFKKPDRTIFKAAAAAADDLDSANIVLSNCMVWGNVKALEEMEILQALSTEFTKINKPRIAEIKKL